MDKDGPVGVQAIHSNYSTLLKLRIGHKVAEKRKENTGGKIKHDLGKPSHSDKSTGVSSHGNAVLLA